MVARTGPVHYHIAWKIDIVPQPLRVKMLKAVGPQEAKNFSKRTQRLGW
ncbi:MAG: hypothetical protein HC913_19725 [Microscillaceae bacterium]|nr:hypothetical protein [Microscillaceae bacterium]